MRLLRKHGLCFTLSREPELYIMYKIVAKAYISYMFKKLLSIMKKSNPADTINADGRQKNK